MSEENACAAWRHFRQRGWLTIDRLAESCLPEIASRDQKITFKEMRAAGVFAVLVYCPDFRASTGSGWSPIAGPMTPCPPTSNCVHTQELRPPRRRCSARLAEHRCRGQLNQRWSGRATGRLPSSGASSAQVPATIRAPEPGAGLTGEAVRPIISVGIAERSCSDCPRGPDRCAGDASSCSDRIPGNTGGRADGPPMITAMGIAIVARHCRRRQSGRDQRGCCNQFPAHKTFPRCR
jgi:hypothetical protein